MGKGRLKHIVTLPKAALNATDHHAFGDKFVLPSEATIVPPNGPGSHSLDHIVTLPKAALNATDHHTFGDKFVFATEIAAAASQPLDHVPNQAASHVPDDVPPERPASHALDHIVTLPEAALNATDHHEFGDKFVFASEVAAAASSASEPLDHVPDQAASHVPDDVPPEGPASHSLDHIVTLPEAALNATDYHTFGDKFIFASEVAAAASSASEPLDHVPDQGTSHVPTDVPPAGLPSDADHMSDTAVTQLHTHVDWLIS